VIFREKPRLREGEPVLPCPACKSQRGQLGKALLHNHVKRNGRNVAVESGDLMECTSCGSVYLVDQFGASVIEPHGLPRRTGPAEVDEERAEAGSEPWVMPLPKDRAPI
jgi:hypothetical protein